MRNSDAATLAALQAAPRDGLASRSLVWITAKRRVTGDVRTFGFWNEHLPVTMNVISGVDGSTQSRTYEADGAILSVGKVPLTSDLGVRNVEVQLSALHPTVAEMARDYVLKLAAIEIHRAVLDATTRLLVAPPRCRFVGTIDAAPRTTPRTGGAGNLTLKCISATAELYRTNAAKRSAETQRRRSNDQHMRYADVCSQWDDLYWGSTS